MNRLKQLDLYLAINAEKTFQESIPNEYIADYAADIEESQEQIHYLESQLY